MHSNMNPMLSTAQQQIIVLHNKISQYADFIKTWYHALIKLLAANRVFKGLITGGRELRQQRPSDLLAGNKSRGCCCRNSRPTVINPDYDMTKQRCMKRIYEKNTSKITTKSSDVAYLPPLWRHASLLNDGSCSFTHPVVKDRSVRGTSSGT